MNHTRAAWISVQTGVSSAQELFSFSYLVFLLALLCFSLRRINLSRRFYRLPNTSFLYHPNNFCYTRHSRKQKRAHIDISISVISLNFHFLYSCSFSFILFFVPFFTSLLPPHIIVSFFLHLFSVHISILVLKYRTTRAGSLPLKCIYLHLCDTTRTRLNSDDYETRWLKW